MLDLAGRALIEKRSMPEPNSGCWLWIGDATMAGYGVVRRNHRRVYAHRVSHEAFVGPIPEGFQVDHKCRVRCCVNPAHLEAVTQAENIRRAARVRTHCESGHELVPMPWGIPGRRYCPTCLNARRRATAHRYYAKSNERRRHVGS